MKNKIGLFCFFVVFLVELLSIALHCTILENCFKPLIVISLLIYLLTQPGKPRSSWTILFAVALVFCLIGDVLLIFQTQDSLFFLLGLSAFLVGHLGYIFFFLRIRGQENIRGRWYLLAPVVLYYALLIVFLSPYLGKFEWPVRIYGAVISLMLMLALHMQYIGNKAAGRRLLAGAALFVLSDSLLAINKFYMPYPGAALAIMFTYGLAQLLMTQGAIRYLYNTYKE